MYREGLFEHHRHDVLALVAAGGTPTAQAALGPVPEGYCWYLENIAWTVIGNSHTALLDVAANPDNGALPAQATWDHANLIATFATAAIRGSLNLGAPVKIDPGHFLIAYLSGGSLAATDTATVTFQLSVHQINVRRIMAPEDADQVQAAHQKLAGPLALSATASERAV